MGVRRVLLWALIAVLAPLAEGLLLEHRSIEAFVYSEVIPRDENVTMGIATHRVGVEIHRAPEISEWVTAGLFAGALLGVVAARRPRGWHALAAAWVFMTLLLVWSLTPVVVAPAPLPDGVLQSSQLLEVTYAGALSSLWENPLHWAALTALHAGAFWALRPPTPKEAPSA